MTRIIDLMFLFCDEEHLVHRSHSMSSFIVLLLFLRELTETIRTYAIAGQCLKYFQTFRRYFDIGTPAFVCAHAANK